MSQMCHKMLNDDYMFSMAPFFCNSDRQDYYMFSKGFLLSFTFHCYREGAISELYEGHFG